MFFLHLFQLELNLFFDAEKTKDMLDEFSEKSYESIVKNKIDSFKLVHPTLEDKERLFDLLISSSESGITDNNYSWKDIIFADEML